MGRENETEDVDKKLKEKEEAERLKDKEEYFEDLRRHKVAYAGKWLDYYTGWRRVLPFSVLFRLAGTLVIAGSVSLPYLAQTTYRWKQEAISIVALGVALLAALSSFFNWHLTWQRRVTVLNALKHYIAVWEVDMVKAKREKYDKAKQDAYLHTLHLFTMVFVTISTESQTFFAELKPPELTKPGAADTQR